MMPLGWWIAMGIQAAVFMALMVLIPATVAATLLTPPTSQKRLRQFFPDEAAKKLS